MLSRLDIERRIMRLESAHKQALAGIGKDDDHGPTGAHAAARGFTEAARRRRDDDDDEGRREDEAEKGNKRLLAEFRDGMAWHQRQHEELMNALHPFPCPDDRDPSIMPAGQPVNPAPAEMVDPVCIPDQVKAFRDAVPGPAGYPVPGSVPHPGSHRGFGAPGDALGGFSHPDLSGLTRKLPGDCP